MTSIDPATLSAPSPTSTHEDIDPSHEAGPARKRIRTQGITTEERRDARAHRNRIAAQNSRDRRKAQFVYLERRVAELEEENRLLRAGAGTPPAAPAALPPLSANRSKVEEERLRDERARERERENEELKERVQTLEGGWDAVIKALGAQGLLTGISLSIAPSQAAPIPTTTSTTAASPTDTTSSLPINTNETSLKPDLAALPSPAPSNDSLESESAATPTTLTDAYSHDPESKEVQSHVPCESARHLAAGGLIIGADAFPDSASVPSGTTTQAACKLSIGSEISAEEDADDNDHVMEALFHELVSPCTTQPAAEALPLPAAISAQVMGGGTYLGEAAGLETSRGASRAEETREDDDKTIVWEAEHLDVHNISVTEWTQEIEMQRLLDEMITMTGLVEGGELEVNDIDLSCGPADFVNPGAGLDLRSALDMGMGLDVKSPFMMSWESDLESLGVF